MSSGAFALGALGGICFAVLVFLLFSMLRSIRDERTPGRSVWREFGLTIVLLVLFLTSWVGQGVAQWQVYTDEQAEHGEETAAGDFLAEFFSATLENWQSEFLQLFSFVALAALYIHKGSGESKDGEEKIEASLRRLEEHFGTLPVAPAPTGAEWQLPDTPLQVEDRP
ncbi:MAG: hypothetical protein M3Z03_07300 [Actinomycetota bacterium]|nr:hypothetical protein [Actinomycetota bacterium]